MYVHSWPCLESISRPFGTTSSVMACLELYDAIEKAL